MAHSSHQNMFRNWSRLVFVWLLCTACSLDTHKPHEQTLLLDWFANPNHIPLYVALDQGFFQDQGLHIVVQKTAEPSHNITYLAQHKADFAVVCYTTLAKAQQTGIELEIIAPLIHAPLNGILYHKTDTVDTLEDLSHKTIGYLIDPNSQKLAQLLEIHRVKHPELIHCGYDLMSLFLAKKIDAAYGVFYTIEGVQAEYLGISTGFVSVTDIGMDPYPELVIAATSPNQAFAKALSQAVRFCQQHPEQAFEIYTKHNPDKSPTTLAWEKRSWKKTLPLISSSRESTF